MTPSPTRRAIFAGLNAVALLSACGDAGFRPLTMNDGPASLSGRVVGAGGEAASGVQVFLVEDGRGVRSARTGGDGRFLIPDVSPGSFELFANGADRGGALRAMTIYANGDNAAGELRLGPYRNFPRLVTYTDVDFEQRVTAGAGELSGPIDAWTVMGREPSAGHQYFYRDTQNERAIVDVELESGEERVEHVFDRAYFDPQLYSGFALVEYELGGTYAVRDIETRRELHRGLLGGGPPSTWRHADGAVLIREQVAEHAPFGHYQERLVRITREGVQASEELFAGSDTHFGIEVIARIGDALLYTPLLDCSERACFDRQIRSVDLRTLEQRVVYELVSIARSLRAIAAKEGAAIVVPRQRSENEFSVTSYPQGVELWEGTARLVEVFGAGAESAVFEVCEDYDHCVLMYARAGSSPVELGQAPRFSGREDEDGRVLIREDDRALWSIELSSGAARRWSLEEVSAQLGRPFCAANAQYCASRSAGGGRAVTWDRSQSGDQVEVAIVDLSADGTIDTRTFNTSQTSPLEPFVRPAGTSAELLFALDANGLNQLYLGESGAPIETFREATHLGSVLRSLVSISADGRVIDYLADDPVTGTQQLFRRELDRGAR